jgi:hypothetical protein
MADEIMDLNVPQNAVERQVFEQQQPVQVPKKEENAAYTQVAGIVVDLDRRLRMLEERYSTLRKKVQLTDHNLIESERSAFRELKVLNEDLMELKRTMHDFQDKIIMFQDELNNTAKSIDLKVIEKYLAMWSPQMFVTRNELKEYLKNKNIIE